MSENQIQVQEQEEWAYIAYRIDVEKFNNRSINPEEGFEAIDVQENVICEIGRNRKFITKLIMNSNGNYIVTEDVHTHKKMIKMKLNSSEMVSKFMGVSVDKKFVKIITLLDYKENKSNFVKVYTKIVEGDDKGYAVIRGRGKSVHEHRSILNQEDWVIPHQLDFYREDI